MRIALGASPEVPPAHQPLGVNLPAAAASARLDPERDERGRYSKHALWESPQSRADVETTIAHAFDGRFRVLRRLGAGRPDLTGTFEVQSSDGREARICHVIRREDRFYRNLTVSSLPHVAAQESMDVRLRGSNAPVTLVLRDKKQIASVAFLDGLVERERVESAFELRMSVLRDVLKGLDAIHRSNRFHGGLRLSNIAIEDDLSSTLLDVGFDSEAEVPNGRAGGDESGLDGQTRDIQDFGILALRMLRGVEWDNRRIDARYPQLRSAAFEWVLDYCTTVNPKDRPTASTLLDALFGGAKETHAVYLANSAGAFRAVGRELSLRPQVQASVEHLAFRQLTYFMRVAPETQIASTSRYGIQRLLRRLAVDELPSLRSNRRRKSLSSLKQRDLQLVDTREVPSEIDKQWRDRLHRAHFGVPLDLAHDERLSRRELAPEERAAQRAYENQIAALNEVRLGLLREHDFIYTQEFAAAMSVEGDPVLESDVTVLRRWGVVLAVPDHGRWLYPRFQLDPETALPSPLISDVHERFRDEEDPWAELAWWTYPRPSLDGRRLCDVLHLKSGSASVMRALERLAS